VVRKDHTNLIFTPTKSLPPRAKHILDQRQKAKTTINPLWCIIELLGCNPASKQDPQMIPWWKKPPTR